MNMVEKMARAICVALGDDPEREGLFTDWFGTSAYGDAATAVLTALSEPDRSMIEAGFLAPHPAYEPADPRDVWQAMLAAASKD